MSSAVKNGFQKCTTIDDLQKSLSEGAVSVDVNIEKDTQNSAAGLIYQINSDTNNYYAFVLSKPNTYAIYQRTQEGLKKMVGGTAKEIYPNRNNKLTIITCGKVKMGSGKYSSSDALVLYLLKFQKRYTICPPFEVVSNILTKLNDKEINKKAVALFWMQYSTTSDVNEGIGKPTFLKDIFEWYILVKQTEKMKISNARLKGYVGAEEAWRKAMNSQ